MNVPTLIPYCELMVHRNSKQSEINQKKKLLYLSSEFINV